MVVSFLGKTCLGLNFSCLIFVTGSSGGLASGLVWRMQHGLSQVSYFVQIIRAGHASILSRQCDHVIRSQVVCNCHFTILLWLPHQDAEALLFFDFYLVPPDWSLRLYYVVVVAKLKKCRVPSSANYIAVLKNNDTRFFTSDFS